jgi:DNA mismatch repair protein MutS
MSETTHSLPLHPALTGDPSELTPAMRQYVELKAQAPDALLLFRMGDFYELFGFDAIEAAKILEITLTSRDRNKEQPLPMAGVPFHSIQGYLQRLLDAGKKVAISEQFEEVPTGKGKAIVRREIVRILSPAIQFESEGASEQFLATHVFDRESKTSALACLEVATGKLLVQSHLSEMDLINAIQALPIRHWIAWEGHESRLDLAAVRGMLGQTGVFFESVSPHALDSSRAESILKSNYGLGALDAFFDTEQARLSAALLIDVACKSQKLERLGHLSLPQPIQSSEQMRLGPRTLEHLDVESDLLPRIQQTVTSAGARALKAAIARPFLTPQAIARRQGAVRSLSDHPRVTERVREALRPCYDLERIAGRISTGLASPRDTLALGKTLGVLGASAQLLDGLKDPEVLRVRQSLLNFENQLQPLSQMILERQREEAPLVDRDGGIFKSGFDSELDRLLLLSEKGSQFLVGLETRERELTQIPSLKVRYNRVFGYYIEVTSTHLKNVPAHYFRKQTTSGGERFFTEELKRFEEEILSSQSRLKSLEQELFKNLVRSIAEQLTPILESSRTLAELDLWCSFAVLSWEPGWCFPEIDSGLSLEIQNGRHPVLDRGGSSGFVPNSLEFSNPARRTLVVTGPNMGGKSTFLRQTAILVLLGQAGSPVPASQARWGVFDSIYTRIGAHDAISRGQSTFMVEMHELAHLLQFASERSLLILDEIGRGTSTYDGMSVAWATLEWISKRLKSRTLFATHYHELTALEDRSSGPEMSVIQNIHFSAESSSKRGDSQLRFLYKACPGPSNESFGIQVAQLAGVPKPVIQRSWMILKDLEERSPRHQFDSPLQMSLFDAPVEPELSEDSHLASEEVLSEHPDLENLKALAQELAAAPIESMTPIAALNYLAKVQETARGFSLALS